MPTFDKVLADALADPEVFIAWGRTQIARTLSIALMGYRSTNKLTQTQLGRQLGLSQARVARIEMGEYDPSMETLRKLAAKLGWTIRVEIAPESSTLTVTTLH